jgi:uncharacterized protein DUF29
MKQQLRKIEPRWERTLRSRETLAEDLGFMGESVGPRTGPNKRTKGEKEDYVLRRLLVAWTASGWLQFPVQIRAQKDAAGTPDFVVSLKSGDTLGVEITEAGEERYQEWLTRAEPSMRSGNVVHVPFDPSTEGTANEFIRRIAAKVDKFDKGAYRQSGGCHLIVYDNTAWGGFLVKRELIDRIRQRNDLSGRFSQIHLVANALVWLDIFGSAKEVDVSQSHEIDFPRWAAAQAAKLRSGNTRDLDRENIAEELEDLGRSERHAVASHLRNLLLHLLKHEFQPKKRTSSWIGSIDNAREELEQRLTESPSLRGELAQTVERQYGSARKRAARQTKMPLDAFPETCPYSLEQLFDDEFLPGSSERRSHD